MSCLLIETLNSVIYELTFLGLGLAPYSLQPSIPFPLELKYSLLKRKRSGPFYH